MIYLSKLLEEFNNKFGSGSAEKAFIQRIFFAESTKIFNEDGEFYKKSSVDEFYKRVYENSAIILNSNLKAIQKTA